MILRPGEQFTIVRQLSDPLDTGTYYVRAEIRNLSTDSVVSTVDLTNKGSQRFQGIWEVTPTQYDYYVSITTTVYTDAGYTTVSPNYAVEAQTLLVAERWGLQFQGGGGSMTPNQLRDIIKATVPDYKPTDLTDIQKQIDANKVDLTDVVNGLEALSTQLFNIERKLESTIDKLDSGISSLSLGIKDTKGTLESKLNAMDIEGTIQEAMVNGFESTKQEFQNVSDKLPEKLMQFTGKLNTEAIKLFASDVEDLKRALEHLRTRPITLSIKSDEKI